LHAPLQHDISMCLLQLPVILGVTGSRLVLIVYHAPTFASRLKVEAVMSSRLPRPATAVTFIATASVNRQVNWKLRVDVHICWVSTVHCMPCCPMVLQACSSRGPCLPCSPADGILIHLRSSHSCTLCLPAGHDCRTVRIIQLCHLACHICACVDRGLGQSGQHHWPGGF
jgi:hypothetical protein